MNPAHDNSNDEFLVRVRDYAERVLRPAALSTDRTGVHADRIDELGGLGLLNHLAPRASGGLAIDRDTDRRVHEIISGACFNTWLVWAQHAPLAGRIAATGAPVSALAARILRGELLLGAGVSDVRRFPEHYVRARKAANGWVFDGTLSWVSGWGLNSALTVSAVEPDTETVVTALVPVGERTRSTGPLRLGAVAGSRTARVRLDEVFVPDENVLTTQSLDRARVEDAGTASDARAHHFGLAETILTELEHSTAPLAADVAATWRPRVAEIRSTAYALADETTAAGGGAHRLDQRLATKVASGEALSAISRALLIARSGRGLGDDDTAQLHARSVLFVLVQGQTADVRRAQLAALAR
ncbi:acyl-CoA dehydrogenase family protein [Nocardia alba]|uniref:Alkylation response protein AidB-like acyl-CoA dehydrogenase n=1 Tax=Nocardia alba TaxID=225051 RepID=A0A4R1FLB1_9NOCA|nr:acyl-CoA dehydrogenase family protein [Nocardia alba]TCJ95587.1 alkylation response protein AidB-like acyl-CoA dehydrogenase [Nocardia alba]